MNASVSGRANHGRADLSERIYFAAFSFAALLLIFWAFAPSYFLRGIYHRPDPQPFIIVHGALMTGWVLLFVLQAALVSSGRRSWHMTLGVAGLAYAALLVPIGCIAVTTSAAREVHGHTDMMLPELNVLGISLMQMLLFGTFVAAAGFDRRRPDYHKRLIVIATLSVLPNAIVRLTLNVPVFSFIQTNLGILNLWAVFCFVIIAADAIRTRRLHPVFAWGGATMGAALYLTWAISRTSAWDQFWIRSLT